MSAYGKAPPQLHGFDHNRPFPEPSFAYTAPPYVSQPSGTANPAAYYNAPQMSSLGYGQRATQYDVQEGGYLNVGSTSIPEVLSYQPTTGGEGTRFQVNISALYEMATTVPMCSIMFSTKKCPAVVTKMQQQGAVCQYLVSTEVPSYQAIAWNSSTLPVYLLVENTEGDLLGKIDVGSFTYDEGRSQVAENQRISHSQKESGESVGIKENPTVRLSADGLPKVELPQYGYATSDNVPQSSFLQPGNSYGGMMTQYSRQAQYQQAPQRSLYYPNSSTSSSPSIKAGSPQVAGWTPYPSASSRGTAASRVARSPVQKSSSMSRPSLTAMPSPMVANPPLIRTSTLQQAHQTPSPAHTPAGTGQVGQSYQYSPYAPKASLKIQGNLDSMAHDWSYEEWETKRRLVLFKRSQNGSEITTSFEAVTADERPHNSICISCIFWPEKQDMFVTSVDTISLLEKLVNARFTVEEKNRIRRNLEGFRPLTVSKGKSDTEEMFKIIMLFPNPKPRNIEKDVKVFPWKILSSALKKIISKYSASPASTIPPAPALLTPVSNSAYTNDSSTITHKDNQSHSGLVSPHSQPRSVSGASASTAYASSRTISPPISKHTGNLGPLHTNNIGPPDLRLSVPSYSSHTQWPSANQHMSASSQHMSGYGAPSHLGDQSARGSWDINSYLQTSPANATPTPQLQHPSNIRQGQNPRAEEEKQQRSRATPHNQGQS